MSNDLKDAFKKNHTSTHCGITAEQFKAFAHSSGWYSVMDSLYDEHNNASVVQMKWQQKAPFLVVLYDVMLLVSALNSH